MEITKENVINALDELPGEHLGEVFDFVKFLTQRKDGEAKVSKIKIIPVRRLRELVGLVAWGGDAVADTERLYEA